MRAKNFPSASLLLGGFAFSSSVSVSYITLCAVVWQTLVPILPLPPIVHIPLSPVCFLEVTSQALPHCTAQPSLNTLTVMLP